MVLTVMRAIIRILVLLSVIFLIRIVLIRLLSKFQSILMVFSGLLVYRVQRQVTGLLLE